MSDLYEQVWKTKHTHGVAGCHFLAPQHTDRCNAADDAFTHAVGGFRLGFALGNRNAIASLEALKAPIDFNQYKGKWRA